MGGDVDAWKEFLENFDKWLKYTCYLAFAWVFLDILPYLPVYIVDRIIDGLLSKVGL